MKDYNMYIAAGSIVTSTEVKVIDEGTDVEHTCLLIYHTDNSMPSDCSPYRILQIVIDHADGFRGSIINSYKDSFHGLDS